MRTFYADRHPDLSCCQFSSQFDRSLRASPGGSRRDLLTLSERFCSLIEIGETATVLHERVSNLTEPDRQRPDDGRFTNVLENGGTQLT